MDNGTYKDIITFVNAKDGQRRPTRIGYLRIEGAKITGRIYSLPIGFDGALIAEDKRDRPAVGNGPGGAPARSPEPQRTHGYQVAPDDGDLFVSQFEPRSCT